MDLTKISRPGIGDYSISLEMQENYAKCLESLTDTLFDKEDVLFNGRSNGLQKRVVIESITKSSEIIIHHNILSVKIFESDTIKYTKDIEYGKFSEFKAATNKIIEEWKIL